MTRERRRQDGTPASLAIGRSCGAARVDALLAGQAAYYSARAPEYDDDAYPGSVELAFAAILDRFDPAGDVLELACGTGHWTPGLLRHARTVTAVDASAEMLAIARARLRGQAVQFAQADLFAWQPSRRYDVVFFGFWLSHVPPARFGAFWSLVASSIRPGGRVLFLDNTRGRRDENVPRRPAGTVLRRLNDGRAYQVVKVAHQPASLAGRLARLGWHAHVIPLSGHFYWGAARPQPAGQDQLGPCPDAHCLAARLEEDS